MLTAAMARLDACANDPRVLPHIAPGEAALSIGWLLTTGAHVFFTRDDEGTDNAALFIRERTPGEFEGHYLFPTLRGKLARRFAVHAVRSMFDNVGASAIIGRVPLEHRSSRIMSRAIGCAPAGHSVDYYGRPCITYRMERDSWAASVA